MTLTAPATAPAVPEVPRPSFAGRFAKAATVGPPKSFMLYGPTGTRKSSNLGRLIATGRFKHALIIDADNGTEVFANDEATRKAVESGAIEILPVDTAQMAPTEAFNLIESTILELAGAWRTPYGHIEPNPNIPDFGYDLVALDTLNIIQTVAVKHFMATTFTKDNKPDTLAAWGKVSVWTEEMTRLMHNTSRFTGVFIMHPKEIEEKTGAVRVKPQLQGSIKDSIATIPSLVAYLSFEKDPTTKQVALTAAVGESDVYDTKNRYMLPSKLYGFDLVELFQIIDAKCAGQPIPQTVMTLGTTAEITAPPAAPAAA